MASYRTLKIADSIKNHVSMIVDGSLADPRIESVTILHVDLARDLSHAKILFTTHDSEPKVIEALLNKASGFVRTQLAQGLNLRYTPTLRFIFDSNFAELERVELVLEKLRAQRAANKSSENESNES
ncbi:30S ribosome-binding factor RbfA [bacterium]|jgi:ribosome-binding factor A|nr:30S ribosome-binding factor RbfA [bacterium]NBX72246.1 30S ribosome-binding factor RbfA [bacterium]